MFENDVTAICSAAGMPTLKIFFIISHEIRSSRRISRMHERERISVTSTSTAEVHCAMTVAHATPATPMSNASTKSRSSAVLRTAETTRK